MSANVYTFAIERTAVEANSFFFLKTFIYVALTKSLASKKISGLPQLG